MCTAQSLKLGEEKLADLETMSEPRSAVPPSLDPQTSTGTFLKPETEARTPQVGWAEQGAGRGLQLCGGGLGPSGSVSCIARSASGGLSVNKGCRPSSQKGRRRNGGHLADEGAPQALSLSEAHAISKSTCSSGLHWKRRDKEV